MIKIIDRYIFKELFEPFFFGLGAFTAILSASMILFDLVRAVVLKGMPLIVALQLFAFKLPAIIIIIFPMATLLGAILAFSRLSHDSEVIAFRASGVSLYRLIVPVAALGLLVAFTNIAFSEIVVPEANKAAKNLVLVTAVQSQPKFQKNVFVPELEKGELRRIFYAESIQGGTMAGVIVQEFSGGKLVQLINAEQARWQAAKSQWLFKKGTVYLLEGGEYKHLIKFDEQLISIKYTPADFFTEERNPDDMTMAQMREYINLKQKMGTDTTSLTIQLYMKMAIPFASLVFALLGAPLGISPRRASGSVGLGLSIIVIFFYYIATFLSMSLGEMKLFTPLIAAWAPNVVTGGAAWYILKKASEK